MMIAEKQAKDDRSSEIHTRLMEEIESIKDLHGLYTLRDLGEYFGLDRYSIKWWVERDILPSAVMLSFLSDNGVDVNYVLTGRRCTNGLLDRIESDDGDGD